MPRLKIRAIYANTFPRTAHAKTFTRTTLANTISRALALLSLVTNVAGAQDRSWMFGPFEKPRTVNPVIAPSTTATVRSAFNDSLV